MHDDKMHSEEQKGKRYGAENQTTTKYQLQTLTFVTHASP